MTAISIDQNINFPIFWKVTNSKTEDEIEVEGKAKARKVAMRIARRIGEESITEKTDKGWKILPVF